MKKLAVLTGGGDVPGLNPAIKALVYRAEEEGFEIIGFRRGWWGPLNYNLDDDTDNLRCVVPFNRQAVRTADRTGGTLLHTSRIRPSHVRGRDVPAFLQGAGWNADDRVAGDFTTHVLKVLERLGIDVLIPIGGDDTLSYAERLHNEGVRIVAIPKTMDNDVFGTDYCIGFSTAITRSVHFIHSLRTTIGSHERIGIIELFGRNSGETSLIAAYLAGVDRAIISEVPFEPEKLARLALLDKHSNPSNYAIITISEGAQPIGGQTLETGEADAYGHKKLGGIGAYTGEILKKLTGENILYQQVAYLMRSGAPDSIDLMVGFNFANMVIDLIVEGKTGRMVSIQKGVYVNVPIDIVSQGTKRVDVEELYDVEEYRPKVRHVDGKPMFLY
jgi:6-phosphofructokinase 1